MPYTPPSASVLVASVARDLRDPGYKTFTSDEIWDLVNLAIVEVGRVYPKERIDDMAVDMDAKAWFTTDALSIFRVEIWEEGKPTIPVPQNHLADSSEGGWDHHAGYVSIPYGMAIDLKNGVHLVRVWGYWPRSVLWEPTDVLDGDAEMEFAVRTVATLNGYQRLQNDRLLFQQWLTNTGNTDVSPNQLAQTADLYQSQWREMRNRLRTLQRT